MWGHNSSSSFVVAQYILQCMVMTVRSSFMFVGTIWRTERKFALLRTCVWNDLILILLYAKYCNDDDWFMFARLRWIHWTMLLALDKQMVRLLCLISAIAFETGIRFWFMILHSSLFVVKLYYPLPGLQLCLVVLNLFSLALALHEQRVRCFRRSSCVLF